MHLEGPAQLAGEEYGYVGELCSYARTHLGCAVLTQRGGAPGLRNRAVEPVTRHARDPRCPDPGLLHQRLLRLQHRPAMGRDALPDLRQERAYLQRVHPVPLGTTPTPAIRQAQEWEEATDYVVAQLGELIAFIEGQTGRPFDWDALFESMSYIKRASELRLEGMELCTNKPTPATYWDWIASIAHINFLPGNQDLVMDSLRLGSRRDRCPSRERRASPEERALPAHLRRHHELEQTRLARQALR